MVSTRITSLLLVAATLSACQSPDAADEDRRLFVVEPAINQVLYVREDT